jgi:transcription initiation factor TFIID TATA-box-binding protein
MYELPKLQNIVSTFSLGIKKKINLKEIALRAHNVEYKPKRFSALIMRVREPNTTALIFSTGKVVLAGSKSVSSAHLAARKFVKIFKKLGYLESYVSEFKIQNVVGSYSHTRGISLDKMNIFLPNLTVYEPELFPGLIYRFPSTKITMLIFYSGKVVITGTNKIDEIFDYFDKIYPVLKMYEK